MVNINTGVCAQNEKLNSAENLKVSLERFSSWIVKQEGSHCSSQTITNLFWKCTILYMYK